MIQSEEFPPYDLQKEFWTLRLYPKGYQRNEESADIPFYLTLCPSHVSSSNQLQIHFRALINFSNPQVKEIHPSNDDLIGMVFPRVKFFTPKRCKTAVGT